MSGDGPKPTMLATKMKSAFQLIAGSNVERATLVGNSQNFSDDGPKDFFRSDTMSWPSNEPRIS